MTVARSGRFTDDVVQGWLGQYLGQTAYVGLLSVDPDSVTDANTAEVSAPTYSRAPSAIHLSGRLLICDDPLLWAGLPPGTTVLGTAVWIQPYNGDPICFGPIPTQLFPTGGSLTIPAGQYAFGLDA